MTHPILTAAAELHERLKPVADTDPVFMTTAEKAEAIRELARVESRVAELRLRVLAAADDVADETSARDAAAWAAVATRGNPADLRGDLRLARALDRSWGVLARAVREGETNLAQARVVARCLEDLPDELPPDILGRAEEVLVGHCREFGPRQLARLGRRILAVVAPDLVEAAEARALTRLEADAHRATRLSLRRQGDGTTRIVGLVPDAVSARLATYLDAFVSPRRSDGDQPPPAPRPRQLGEAFCHLLEAVDPDRLPTHAGDATTVLVTLSLDSLRADLATADLLSGPDGDDVQITASQARRLACNARLVPVVLGGDSEVLDLGRGQRLFNRAIRRALRLRDRTCRAEGCDIPGSWAEAHHWSPWSLGGPTSLANGVLLCSHHHHRAHDPGHTAERLANGDVRFHHRT